MKFEFGLATIFCLLYAHLTGFIQNFLYPVFFPLFLSAVSSSKKMIF